MKKNLAVLLGGIGLFVIVAIIAPKEKDPAYRPHPATYYGRPCSVQLHRPSNDGLQWITFTSVSGQPIVTVPTELALEMYHEREGY